MSTNKERLELVTDFSSLKAGMIVVVKPCDRCPGSTGHRGMLVEFEKNARSEGPKGDVTVEDDWTIAPAGPCGADSFGEPDVIDRTVFRVVDGLDPDADREADHVEDRHAALHATIVRRNARVRP